MVNLSRIQSLHPGQIAIVVGLLGAASFAAFGRLELVRGERAVVEHWIFERQLTLDSLDRATRTCSDTNVQLFDSVARFLNRAKLESRLPSSGGFIEPIARNCSEIPTRRISLENTRVELADRRDRLGKRGSVWKAIILVSAGMALGVLWVWFDARHAA
jgi:hypothetical protein